MPLTASGHIDVDAPLLAGTSALQAAWGKDAAAVAALILQRPFRVALHASSFLPPKKPQPPEEPRP
jgi:hypothetical protein